MSKTLATDKAIGIAPGFRFQWEEAQSAFVLLYPEGMIKLGESAGEILKRCDGSFTADGIVSDLKQQFPEADLENDVRDFLAHACDKGWIVSQ